MTALEAPDSPDDLYLARGDDVMDERPVCTGDVFTDVAVADSATVIVLTHPCSMRLDGVNLAPRLAVAPVVDYQRLQPSQWQGHLKVMPLPDLPNVGDNRAARLDHFEPAISTDVVGGTRIACLSRFGINLLIQRFVSHLTRFVPPTADLDPVCAPVMEEIDLMEEWLFQSADAGMDLSDASQAFHEWIRADDGGTSRQDRLKDPQQRSSVRRQMTRSLRDYTSR